MVYSPPPTTISGRNIPSRDFAFVRPPTLTPASFNLQLRSVASEGRQRGGSARILRQRRGAVGLHTGESFKKARTRGKTAEALRCQFCN